MAKKAEKADPKKECPSCGLGVSPESSVCEFCGWDFEEEDEWILQIEKLERDLMLEKQKFEPGTVNHMIETTLRTPVLEKLERTVTADEEAIEEDEEEAAEEPAKVRSVRAPEPEPVPQRKVAPEPPVRKAAPQPDATSPPSVPQRRVRTIASSPPSAAEEETVPTRRVRTVRKVKQ